MAQTMEQAPRGQFSPAGLRRLKVLVIGLGVAFFAAFALFIWLLVGGAGRSPRVEPGAWTRSLDLPAGTVVAGIAAVGDTVVVHVRGAAGDERLLVVEPRTGRTIGVMTVTGR